MPAGRNIPFADPSALIEALKQHPAVLAILRYGSATWPEGADTDLCVVVAERPAGLESVHFWLECGPVDLNLRTLDELIRGGVCPEAGLDDVLRQGEVLYERRPGMLTGLSGRRPSAPVPSLEELAPGMRFGHAHYLHKLDHYKDRDPLLCKVLLCGAAHWLLRAYVAVRGLPYRGEKAALEALTAADPDLRLEMETALGDGPLTERVGAIRRLTEQVLAPAGGPWRRGEVIFLPEEGHDGRIRDEWRRFFASLIGRS